MAPSVLIIDDDEKLARLLSRFLEQTGFSVSTESSPENGIERIGKARFDIVVVDLMMPRMDGLEVCRRIQASHQVPIILISARADGESLRLSLQPSCQVFLAKPFSPDALVAHIRAALIGAGPGL